MYARQIAASLTNGICENGTNPVVTDWEEIKLESFLNLNPKIEAVIGKSEEEADVQDHLKEIAPMLIHPVEMLGVIANESKGTVPFDSLEMVQQLLYMDIKERFAA